ncbi:class I SAM-dependent methyltransferase [Erythrobacter sp.]|uniref:class I SAM-dependent DNA methyltransferase n=1 Tax=Erythrobacter sp. TaxID=1042 RepID=UPI001425CD96|nr:class I SAM-dependent methyltransferase [Erythrobacter sp.]QIQ85371.1 MAG: methyltransferase domain-containing protein [Erythrobacter sp.]
MNAPASERRRTFDGLYRRDPDPWDCATSRYERVKRSATLAALGERDYESALEIGCGAGLLTRELARRCRRLVALDVSEVALAQARTHCSGARGITFARCEVPRDWPHGRFDLVMLSEVLYFLTRAEIEEVSRMAHDALEEDGACVLVNWTGENDLPVCGQQAAEIFARAAGWQSRRCREAQFYRIDVLRPDL